MTIFLNATTGSDSTGNGTAGNPYQTIEKGFTEASAGDVIEMQASPTAFSVVSYDYIPSNILLQGDTYPQKIGAEKAIIDFGGSRGQWEMTDHFVLKNCLVRNMIDNAGSWIYTKKVTPGIDSIVRFENVHLQDLKLYRSTGSRGGLVGGGYSVSGFNYNTLTFTMDRCILENIKTNSSTPASLFVGIGSETLNTINCTLYNNSSGTYNLSYLASTGNGSGPLANISHKNLAYLNEHADAIDLGLANNETTNGMYYSGAITQTANTTNAVNQAPQFIDKAASIFYLEQDDPGITGGVAV